MTDREKWTAVAENDAACDGLFYYAVKSTGVYCRPSCPSRRPNAGNVVFFDTAEEAEGAGFRPCRRCRPELVRYEPARALAERLRHVIDAGGGCGMSDAEQLDGLGVMPKRAARVFREQYGMTPGEYADRLRMGNAYRQLRETLTPILDIAYALGFESLSAFYSFFGRHAGITPGEYRRNASRTADNAFVYDTSFGRIAITADGHAVTRIRLGAPDSAAGQGGNALADVAAIQLEEYFTGRRTEFTVPMCPEGTEFQRLVWCALQDIPYGETRSYKQVAQAIGRPTASRAVGMANNKNPIMVMIPCHRVVGADGALVGYAAGLAVKQRLLELERR